MTTEDDDPMPADPKRLAERTLLVVIRGFERFGPTRPGKGVLLVCLWPDDAPMSAEEVAEEWYAGDDDDPPELIEARALVIDRLGLRCTLADLERGGSINRRPGSKEVVPEDLVCLFDGGGHSPRVLRAIPLASTEGLRAEWDIGWADFGLEVERLLGREPPPRKSPSTRAPEE